MEEVHEDAEDGKENPGEGPQGDQDPDEGYERDYLLPPWMRSIPPWFMRQPRPPPQRFLRPIQHDLYDAEEEHDLVPPFLSFPPFFRPPFMPSFSEEDDYPLPEFLPLPPPPPPMDDYPFLFESARQKLQADRSNRKRREALMETYDIHDPQEWWNDVDGGSINPVTKALAKGKSGIASQQMMLAALDTFSPALHVGEIDTGYLRNPELEQASDRTFGYDSDFYMGDMGAFRFTPQGERVKSLKDFYRMVKSGQMPLGQRYILHSLFFSNCFECYLSKDLDKVKNIRSLMQEVNPMDDRASAYWRQLDCDGIRPGQYIFLSIKKYEGINSWILIFQDPTSGYQIAVRNPDVNGMQAVSSYNTVSASRGLYNDNEGSTAYYSVQPDETAIYNSAMTRTGTRWGDKSLPTYKLAKANRPRYDQSRVWTENTWESNPMPGYHQYSNNARVVGRSFQHKNNYFGY